MGNPFKTRLDMSYIILQDNAQYMEKKRNYIVASLYSPLIYLLLHLESSHNASNQLLSNLFSKRGVLITMISTTIGLSLIYALLLKYWKNLSYPKFLYNWCSA